MRYTDLLLTYLLIILRNVLVCQETQSELEAARTETKRQSSDLEMSTVEKERLVGKLKAAQGTSIVFTLQLLVQWISS